jgi:hypothetical protein
MGLLECLVKVLADFDDALFPQHSYSPRCLGLAHMVPENVIFLGLFV